MPFRIDNEGKIHRTGSTPSRPTPPPTPRPTPPVNVPQYRSTYTPAVHRRSSVEFSFGHAFGSLLVSGVVGLLFAVGSFFWEGFDTTREKLSLLHGAAGFLCGILKGAVLGIIGVIISEIFGWQEITAVRTLIGSIALISTYDGIFAVMVHG